LKSNFFVVEQLISYQKTFLAYLENLKKDQRSPKELYEPIDYILNIGGKRIRPILALMAADVFGISVDEALPAAMAVEIFHNFSLVHDDIMDQAPLRRGEQTVHLKWDTNTAILSGDAMLVMAYQQLEAYTPDLFVKMIKVFSKTALQVCEGQQYDMNFENDHEVHYEEYLNMITGKTAVLIGAALKMGAIAAKSTDQEAQVLYDFGKYLGVAFQIQDDYLDAFGNPEKFGKMVGGDIIAGKKTLLYLKAMQLGTDAQKQKLQDLYVNNLSIASEDKVAQVKALFKEIKADKATKSEMEAYTQKAFACLEQLRITTEKKKLLTDFGVYLMNRRV